jgi:hypothetical protein
MTYCRTIDDVIAAATADAAQDAPLTQEQADLAAALLAPYTSSADRHDSD